jgi:hypothetical protein
LLNDVRQFMGQQPSTRLPVGLVLTLAKDDVLPDGVSPGVHCAGRGRALTVRVYPDGGEVVVEARFHSLTRSRVQRLTGRAQNFVHDGRHRGDLGVIRGTLLYEARPYRREQRCRH